MALPGAYRPGAEGELNGCRPIWQPEGQLPRSEGKRRPVGEGVQDDGREAGAAQGLDDGLPGTGRVATLQQLVGEPVGTASGDSNSGDHVARRVERRESQGISLRRDPAVAGRRETGPAWLRQSEEPVTCTTP